MPIRHYNNSLQRQLDTAVIADNISATPEAGNNIGYGKKCPTRGELSQGRFRVR